jgi:hypothetical protein
MKCGHKTENDGAKVDGEDDNASNGNGRRSLSMPLSHLAVVPVQTNEIRELKLSCASLYTTYLELGLCLKNGRVCLHWQA